MYSSGQKKFMFNRLPSTQPFLFCKHWLSVLPDVLLSESFCYEVSSYISGYFMCFRFNIVCMNNRLDSMALRILLGEDSPLRKAT